MAGVIMAPKKKGFLESALGVAASVAPFVPGMQAVAPWLQAANAGLNAMNGGGGGGGQVQAQAPIMYQAPGPQQAQEPLPQGWYNAGQQYYTQQNPYLNNDPATNTFTNMYMGWHK